MSEARELFRKGKESIKKNWIRAYQYFLEAKNSDPSFIPVYSEIADLLYKRGFVKEAFSVIEEGMKVKPDDQMLLFAMANLYLSTGKPGPALRYYHRLYKELDNPPADIYFLMGLCHSLLGHYRKALALVKRAITMDHYLFEAHDLYGRLCIETGKYEEAESSYRYILQFDSEDSHAHYMLGIVLARQYKWREAIEQWERVLELSPEDDDAIRELGWAWNMIGDSERSMRMLKKALELNPYNLQARIDLSAVLIGKRYLKEAVKELEIARELDPQNDLIEKLLKELKGGLGSDAS